MLFGYTKYQMNKSQYTLLLLAFVTYSLTKIISLRVSCFELSFQNLWLSFQDWLMLVESL